MPFPNKQTKTRGENVNEQRFIDRKAAHECSYHRWLYDLCHILWAGNLIFPSYLGFVGGSSGWLGGFIAFVIADAVLGILGLVASARYPQTEIGAYYRVGNKFMVIFGVINLFFAGNIIVNPRTAATAFEVATAANCSRLMIAS